MDPIPPGTVGMDPFEHLDAYIVRYDLTDAADDDIHAVVDDWSQFLAAEKVTGSLFDAPVPPCGGRGGGSGA